MTNSWRDDYLRIVKGFLKENKTFHGGRLCHWCREAGLREPLHHNEWVSMVQILKKLELIESRGKMAPDTPQSHIDQVNYWESKLFSPADRKFLEDYV